MVELVLEGCRPIPLAGYLKALGVLRLLAEQADPEARGWWEGDRFRLRTALSREQFVRFFLHEYCPTPIMAPWNGRAGFLEGESEDSEPSERTGAQLIRAYAEAGAERFRELKEAVEAFSALPVVKELDQVRLASKVLVKAFAKQKLSEAERQQKSQLDSTIKRVKSRLLSEIRAEVGEHQFAWLDVCLRLADQNANSPLLIAGGADGSRDYGMAFGIALQKLFSFCDGAPTEGDIGPWLAGSLFGEAALLADRDSLGHLNPGQGGYNATNGYEGYNPVNPWDIVIALEGAVLWRGGITRRLDDATDLSAASFPFSFNMSRAGSGQLSVSDQNRTPGELWCPLWDRPVGIVELGAFFREGRLTVGRRLARTGLDAALAVSMLGGNRGIRSFIRVGLYQTDAKMPHTTATLGRHEVTAPSDMALLATELADHPWLAALRREARSKEASRALQGAVRTIDDCLFGMISPVGRNSHAQDVLVALGAAARLIAVRPKLQDSVQPPPEMSRRWIGAADDGSQEFRLAVALAGLRARMKVNEDDATVVSDAAQNPTRTRLRLPMRAHFGPLDPERYVPRWSAEKGSALAVWGPGQLVSNLCAVANLRLLERTRNRLIESPFDSAIDEQQDMPVAVHSGEILAFLNGEVRDERITDLLLGLAWVRPGLWSGTRRAGRLPFAYAALKPLFTPPSVFRWLKDRGRLNYEIADLPMPPALPLLLSAGRVEDAVRVAQQRARGSGLPTPFLQKRRSNARVPEPDLGRRLLAALIIPVRASIVGACMDQVYPSVDQLNSDEESSHGI